MQLVPLSFVVLALLQAFILCPQAEDLIGCEIRLEKLLVPKDEKTKDWVCSPWLRFLYNPETKEIHCPVIELQRGWHVPSWKGVVDTVEVSVEEDGLKGNISFRVHSAQVVSGKYEVQFDAITENGAHVGAYEALHEEQVRKGELSWRLRIAPHSR